MTFRSYIRSLPDTDDAIGDFKRDTMRDEEFRNFNSWEELQGYLFMRNACQNAVETAHRVWANYRATKE